MAKVKTIMKGNAGDVVRLIAGGNATILYGKVDNETRAQRYWVQPEGDAEPYCVIAEEIAWPEPAEAS
jgi:hypothetical protein